MDQKIDTLSRYGKEFQEKTIALLITDKSFLDQIIDALSINFYDSEAKKWIVEKTVEYYQEYKKSPSQSYFKSEFQSLESQTLRVSVLDELRKAWNKKDDEDLEYVKDEFLNFAKNQRVKQAILDAVPLLKEGNYEKIKQEVSDALNSGVSRDIGHVYKKEIESRLSESSRKTVPSGWRVINEVIDGGLGPGELGVVVAPSGAGKSWTLCHLGLSAVKQGFNVLHYTLELDEDQTGLRYDSILSGYSPTEVREHKEELMEVIEGLNGNLNIKQFPTKSASVQTLSSHFEKVQAIEGRPDVILVDYADLLSTITKKNKNSENTYLQMGNIYTQIRKMAGELQVPVWTVSQSRRDSIDKEVIQADMIADSYKKIMISDVVLSLSRTKSDKLSNTARFHFIKNRFGQDGLTFPSIMDTESGTIEVYDPESQYGAEVKDKMSKSEGQAEMEALRDQYNDYKKRTNGEADSPSTSVEDLLESKKEEKKTNISV